MWIHQIGCIGKKKNINCTIEGLKNNIERKDHVTSHDMTWHDMTLLIRNSVWCGSYGCTNRECIHPSILLILNEYFLDEAAKYLSNCVYEMKKLGSSLTLTRWDEWHFIQSYKDYIMQSHQDVPFAIDKLHTHHQYVMWYIDITRFWSSYRVYT